MSRFPAYDDDHEYAIDRKPLADLQQAMYFKALLDERRAEVVREIADKAAALAQSPADDGTRVMRHLQRGLAAAYRERVDLDRLRNSLRVRLTADVPEINLIRPFDIVITRRRSGWRIEIAEFGIVLPNVDSRTDAEVISRSILAAIADCQRVNDDAVPPPAVVVGPR